MPTSRPATPEEEIKHRPQALEAATEDMKIAREQGMCIVCQTKHGNLYLYFDRIAKTYTLETAADLIEVGGELTETMPKVIATGKARTVKPALADQYQIIIEEY
jgi:hypothetical protein